METTTPEQTASEETALKMGRLSSLDAMRGLTIAAMIMVNAPGTEEHVYRLLHHVPWNGWVPADLIFPFFIFMVGVSIAFAYTKHLAQGTPRHGLAAKVVIRSLKIYVVGMLLYAAGCLVTVDWNEFSLLPFLAGLRYTGVLHRIAVVFLVCGLLFLYTKWWVQLAVCLFFLVGYCFCMTCIPTPGQGGQVMLEPGNNLAAWVDSQYLPGSTWWNENHPQDVWTEDMTAWDPEGILSTFPSISSGLIGIFAGVLLLSRRSQERKAVILFFSGFLLLIGGYLWDQCFPLNKSLWTSSYVLFTSGLACMTLASLLYYMDILGRKTLFHFAVIFGCNAITIYCLADILSWFLYGNSFGFFGEGSEGLNHLVMDRMVATTACSMKFASMAYSVLLVGLCFVPAYILYKLKIFIRL